MHCCRYKVVFNSLQYIKMSISNIITIIVLLYTLFNRNSVNHHRKIIWIQRPQRPYNDRSRYATQPKREPLKL